MTSALYLEHYLDGLENLPNELKRNFTLMRELDTRAQTLMKQIDEKSKVLMSTMVQPEKANELLKNPNNIEDEKVSSSIKVIQDLFNKAKEYGDDKVQLAIQTYELVDKHIRRLDSDLARFEGEIQDKTVSAQGKTEEVLGKKGRKKIKDAKVSGKKTGKRSLSDEDEKVTGEKSSTGTQNKSSSKKNKVNQEKEGRKNQKKKDDSEDVQAEGHLTPHPSDVLDMPVDPNEPTYCLCHQVSYGEMIGCDNPDCPIEWFHFACVGLTIKPRGKWYCYGCLNKKK